MTLLRRLQLLIEDDQLKHIVIRGGAEPVLVKYGDSTPHLREVVADSDKVLILALRDVVSSRGDGPNRESGKERTRS